MKKHLKTLAILFGVLIISLGGAIRFSSIQYPHNHPDEIIAVKVSEMIIAKGSLDTNWENADLPAYFKYPQYNFSGYNIFSAGVITGVTTLPLKSISPLEPLEILRYSSAALGTLMVLITILLGRQIFNIETGFLAALLVAINPLLYQDSLYARPEAFVTTLTLIILYILGASKIYSKWILLLASAILGVLVSTKISMLVLFPLLFLPNVVNKQNNTIFGEFFDYFKSCIKLIPKAILPITIGFIIGLISFAPYAVINYEKFLFGFRALNHQYSTGHWPHGLIEGSSFDRLGYAANYFFPTQGFFLFILTIIGAWLTIKERRFRSLFIFIIFSVFAIQFSIYPAFFERNFSHLLPIFCIFASFGLTKLFEITLNFKPAIRIILITIGVLLAFTPSIKTSYILMIDELQGKSSNEVNIIRANLEYQLGIKSMQLGWGDVHGGLVNKYDKLCEPVLLKMPYLNEKHSINFVAELKSIGGFSEMGRFNSPFYGVSPSTLDTYFTTTTLFLFKDLDYKNCINTISAHVSKNAVGGIFNNNLSYLDFNWTKQGAFGKHLDPFDENNYYGSWSGSDAGKGIIRFEVLLDGNKNLILPYLTGPVSERQLIKVQDAESFKTIFYSGPLKKSDYWKLLLIRIPSDTHRIIIEGSDEGGDWGEWHALGLPRMLKNNAP